MIIIKKLKVLDLFSGTQSIAKAFRDAGHETYTIELDKTHEGIDWYEDIMNITAQDIIDRFGRPDVIWASPPCEKFSVAAIGRHWIKGTELPKTKETAEALKLLEYTVQLIKDLNPTYYFIENPRGKMRKMECMQDLPRNTVSYCQYGDFRMKPTDLWSNHPNPKFKPMCKNGDPCHVAAPRGSSTGTQGLKSAIERSRIPDELCKHIVSISEEPTSLEIVDWLINQVITKSQGFQLIIDTSYIEDTLKIIMNDIFAEQILGDLQVDDRVLDATYDVGEGFDIVVGTEIAGVFEDDMD